MPEFKVGDRVEYTGAFNAMTPEWIGRKGVVKVVGKSQVEVLFDNYVSDRMGGYCGVLLGNLRLVTSAVAPIPQPSKPISFGDLL